VRVKSAEVVNGLLTIKLVSEIPEEQKPQQIAVKF
jgi:HSP20 family molecular chaperone IbpA